MKYPEKQLQHIYSRIVKSMSGLADIKVEVWDNVVPHYEPEVKTIRTFKVVPYAKDEEDDFLIGRGVLIHEAGHVLFLPSFRSVMNAMKNKYGEDNINELQHIANVYADLNNEYKTTMILPHLKEPLVMKTERILEAKPNILTSDNPFMQMLMRGNRLHETKAIYPTNFPQPLKEFVEKWTIEYDKRKIYSCRGRQLEKFVRECFEDWMNLKKEVAKNNLAISKQINKLMQEIGECIKGGNAQGAGKLKREVESLKGQMGAGINYKDPIDKSLLTKNADLVVDADYSEMTLEELKAMLKKKQEEDKTGSSGGWGCDLVDLSKYKVTPCLDVHGKDRFPIDWKRAYEEGKKINRALRSKVTLQETFEQRHRSGTIDFGEIRHQIGKYGKIIKEHLFQRNNTFSRGGEFAVEILIDCSGSMSKYPKMTEAKQAAATLYYALHGLPNVHFAMTGYTAGSGDGNGANEIPIKRFNRNVNKDLLDNLEACGGNEDGINIRVAIKRLIGYGNQVKKMLIVINDGQPAYNLPDGTDGITDTRDIVKRAEKLGIKVIGIGIEGVTEKSFKEIYKNHYLFKTADNNMHKDIVNIILSALGQRDKTKLIKRRWD